MLLHGTKSKPFFLFLCLIALIASRMRREVGRKQEENASRQMNPLFLASSLRQSALKAAVGENCLRPSVTDVCVERVPYRVQITHLVKARTSKHDDMEVHCLLGFSPFEGLM